MLTATFALFCLAGWIATGAVFVIAMSGSADMRAKERARTDRAEARVRELLLLPDTNGTGSPVFDGLAVERLRADVDGWAER